VLRARAFRRSTSASNILIDTQTAGPTDRQKRLPFENRRAMPCDLKLEEFELQETMRQRAFGGIWLQSHITSCPSPTILRVQ